MAWHLVLRLFFFLAYTSTAMGQKGEIFGGGTKSNFANFKEEGMQAFMQEMTDMQEWYA